MKKMVGIAVGVIVIGIAGVVYLNHYMQKDIIYSNVFINEVPVENMTKQEALNTVSQKERFQSAVFQFQDREFRYPVEELGFSFNYEDAVEQAYSIGKEGTFFDRIKSIFSLKVLQQKQNITLQYREDSSKLEEKASEINGKIYQQAQDATISVETNFEITPEVVGRKVELDKIEGLVKQNLKSNEDIVISLPVKEVIPKVKKEDLEHINGKLGQFSTRFNSSLTGRTENIRMATRTLNSTILMPG
ncbi:peptidoglycan binding domain-containing protein, partial [Filifactor alocis]